MNWGHKLMIVFIAFAAMMSYLAYRAFKTEFELVDKDYYKNELKYQEVIDGTNSVVVQQAANRMHVQKALLAEMLGGLDVFLRRHK